MKLLLWVEGPTDACKRAGRVDGALYPLLKKLLSRAPRMNEARITRMISEQDVEVIVLKERLKRVTRFGGSGKTARKRESVLAFKLRAALDQEADLGKATLVVGLWDHDGRDDRLKPRDKMHDFLRERNRMGAAFGVAVQEIEAWLLDEVTLKACFGAGPSKGISGSPEDIADPKEELSQQLQHYPTGEDVPATYSLLAGAVDIERLKQRCPQGFGQLAEDVETFLYPALSVAGQGTSV